VPRVLRTNGLAFIHLKSPNLGGSSYSHVFHISVRRHLCLLMLTCLLFRPSSAIISAIQNEKRAFETILLKLKNSTPDERARISDQISIVNGAVNIQEVQVSAADINQQNPRAWPETPRPSIPLTNSVAATPLETVPDNEDPDGTTLMSNLMLRDTSPLMIKVKLAFSV
jgi:hypothetical protein